MFLRRGNRTLVEAPSLVRGPQDSVLFHVNSILKSYRFEHSADNTFHSAEHERRRDTRNPGFHPNATNTTPRPRTAIADEDVEETIPEHIQSSVDRSRETFASSVQARGATLTPSGVPMSPASNALISALDAESFHSSPRGQSRVQSPAAHSQASEDLTHSSTSSMSNNRGYGQESEHHQYSEGGDSLPDTERYGDGGETDAHDHRDEEGSAPSTIRPEKQVPTGIPGVPASNAQEHQPAHNEW
ncbi:MAG: hypothetical protein LQ350_004998 [Teloschistes chrysophthalmus]|nr:MAG: hypothetical protein LQ350_004998 [Niorma chrysophthalma]